MCLGANEPGGPRRCEAYFRDIGVSMDMLRTNLDEQHNVRHYLAYVNKQRDELNAVDASTLDEQDRESLFARIRDLENRIVEAEEKLDRYIKAEPAARAYVTSKIQAHEEESERRRRMDASKQGEQNPTSIPVDDAQPFITVSPDLARRIIESAQGAGLGMGSRIRYVPVVDPDGGVHPMLTVKVVDLQSPDRPDVTEHYRNTAMEGDDLGHNNTDAWYATSDTVLHAAYLASDGGSAYVSQADAKDNPNAATSAKVRAAILMGVNENMLSELPPVISEIREFAKNYPGDNAYSAKIREIAARDYVLGADVPVLASAISGWHRYHARQAEPGRVQPLPQEPSQTAAKAESVRRQPRRNEHVGTVSERIEPTKMTVQAAKQFESNFGGTNTLIMLTDEQGHTFKWMAPSAMDVSKGDALTLSGIIKDHAEYNGTKQTVLKNVKMAS